MSRRLVAEFFGTAMLLCTVVGSGIMAERLADGNIAIALLANTIATGAILGVLILMLAPISGAHFNPAVSIGLAVIGEFKWADAALYILVQAGGGILGVVAANVMFDLSPVTLSTNARGGNGQLLGEFIATFGLIAAIIAVSRRHGTGAVAAAVACYITAAYWFTSSTSFANPAVTLARSLSNTFTGIRPVDVPGFIAAQAVGAIAAAVIFNWLVSKTKL